MILARARTFLAWRRDAMPGSPVVNSISTKATGLPPAIDLASGDASAARLAPRRWAAPVALAAGDALGFAVAVLAGRQAGWLPADDPHALPFVAVVAALCLLLCAGASLYPGTGLYEHEQWRRRLQVALTVALGAFGVAAVLLPDWPAVTQVGPMLLLALLLQAAIRWALVRQLVRLRLWGTEVAVLAAPELAPRIADALRVNWRLGLVPVLPTGAGSSLPTTAVLAGPLPSGPELQAHVRGYEAVLLLADLPGLRLSGLQPASLGGRVGIVLRDRRSGAGHHRLRGAVDRAVALVALAPALPVMALAAAAIYLADPGPVLYRQEREGLGGRTLRVIKLRTMYRDAERRLDEVLASDPARREEWERRFKLRDDPRILPVIGGFLRSTSCDELPQLLNVLAGEMSLVGPRPFPAYHLGAMDAEFRVRRRSVMPGLTGLWQVSVRSEADLEGQQQLDDFYIDNRSVWLDGHILFRTVRAVLGRGGAY
jgi:lipopolysaccharide/colanic/teichoic acid biosynthesis glycosyltransferase